MHGDPQGMAGDGERRTQVVVAITLVMMVVEIATGRLPSSVALLADGWHMGTHAAALGITLYAYHFTRTHPDMEEGSSQASRASSSSEWTMRVDMSNRPSALMTYAPSCSMSSSSVPSGEVARPMVTRGFTVLLTNGRATMSEVPSRTGG